MHIKVRDKVPSFTHCHTPWVSSQATLSREALETPKDKPLDPAFGACVPMWVLRLPGSGKRGWPHLFASGSTVSAVTLRTKNVQVRDCPNPGQPLTTPPTQHMHSPWGQDFLEHQGNPGIRQNTKGSHKT